MRLLNVSISEVKKQCADPLLIARLSQRDHFCVLERKTSQKATLPYLLLSGIDLRGLDAREIEEEDLSRLTVEAAFVRDHRWHEVSVRKMSVESLRQFVSSSFPIESLFVYGDPHVINAPSARYSEVWTAHHEPLPIVQINNGEMFFSMSPEYLLAWFRSLPELLVREDDLDDFPIMRSGDLPRMVGAGLVRWDIFAGNPAGFSLWLVAKSSRSVGDFHRFDFYRFASIDEPKGFITIDIGKERARIEGKDRFQHIPKHRPKSNDAKALPAPTDEIVDAEFVIEKTEGKASTVKAVTVFKKEKKKKPLIAKEQGEKSREKEPKTKPRGTKGKKKKPATPKKKAN